MSKENPIEITPKTVFCPGHGELLRKHWPSGFLRVAMYILQSENGIFVSDDFVKACGGDTDFTADVSKINAVLAVRPMCYFLSRDTIRQAYMESADIFTVGVCVICKRSGIGGPYQITQPTGIEELDHVCLECALDVGERIHRAKPKGNPWI
jgi:hypothetical protein